MLDLSVARAECACQASKVIHKLDGLPSCFGAAEDQKSHITLNGSKEQ
jgi:hypothetical protein